jgi:hypothetical protein
VRASHVIVLRNGSGRHHDQRRRDQHPHLVLLLSQIPAVELRQDTATGQSQLV